MTRNLGLGNHGSLLITYLPPQVIGLMFQNIKKLDWESVLPLQLATA